ncbi:MAG: DUF5652 family protein [Candidatus Paceibacterota bacterium]
MNDLNLLFANSVSDSSALIIIALLLIWGTIWKGIALWKSARLSQKKWFIILLIVNTAGILEIIYIFLVNKKKKHLEDNK